MNCIERTITEACVTRLFSIIPKADPAGDFSYKYKENLQSVCVHFIWLVTCFECLKFVILK